MDIDLAELREGAIYFVVLVASLCLHEWGHAFAAHRLGDDTPAQHGRLTLNPLPHLDLFGSILFPFLCIFVFKNGLFFAWAKPVLTDSSNFKHPRRDELLVTLAGPALNLLLALFAAVAGGLLFKVDPRTAELFFLVIQVNVWLAVFNLIPLPPLDGGLVLRHAVGMSEEMFLSLSRWSFLILLVAINLPPVRWLIGAAITLTAHPLVLLYNLLAH
jgi:Zn-dependent protease